MENKVKEWKDARKKRKEKYNEESQHQRKEIKKAIWKK
jgi:hypothetical protein